jgi:phosphonate transport system substrate-binding protein
MNCEVSFNFGSQDVYPVAFLAGEADFGIFSFSLYFPNRDAVPVSLLLIPDHEQSAGFYRSAFIARADSGGQSIFDFEGKTFAYTGRGDLRGYLMPRVLLSEAGYDPNTFFTDTHKVGGSTLDMVNSVANGNADIGVVWEDENMNGLEWAMGEVPDAAGELKVLDATPWIPNLVVGVLSEMPEDQQELLKNGFMGVMETDSGRDTVKNIYRITAFNEPDERLTTAMDLLTKAELLDLDLGSWP